MAQSILKIQKKEMKIIQNSYAYKNDEKKHKTTPFKPTYKIGQQSYRSHIVLVSI